MKSAPRVLIVGSGGLGAPSALILARSGIALELVDDDRVEITNLQRQILFTREDLGEKKVVAARTRLLEAGAPSVEAIDARVLPSNASELFAGASLILDGTDNYATKFMIFDHARAAGVPIVSAGAVRLSGWTMASFPEGGPCFRCVFEDLPEGPTATCAEAGVVGPVVGLVGALQASLALRILHGAQEKARGLVLRYEGMSGSIRSSRPLPRKDCESCADPAAYLSTRGYASN